MRMAHIFATRPVSFNVSCEASARSEQGASNISVCGSNGSELKRFALKLSAAGPSAAWLWSLASDNGKESSAERLSTDQKIQISWHENRTLSSERLWWPAGYVVGAPTAPCIVDAK